MDVDTVLDELFAAPREEFTALRDTRVKQARTEGDTELVGQLKRLRKPTVAAWLVNQVSRAHPEDVERLAKVGDALRAAHHALAGDQLRDLSRERNDLIHVLTGHARAIAGEAGQALGDATVDQMESTWTAAVTADAAARLVRAGRLSSAMQPDAPQDWLTAAMGAPAPARPRQDSKPSPGKSDTDTDNADLAKQEAVREARRSVEQKARARDKARNALTKAEQAATDAEATMNDLQQQLAALQARVANATEREKTSRKRADTAREEVTIAEQAAAEAEELLSRLEANGS
jgi:hypothetical protein